MKYQFASTCIENRSTNKLLFILSSLIILLFFFSSCATEVDSEEEQEEVGISDPELVNQLLRERQFQQALLTDYSLPSTEQPYVELVFEHVDTLKIKKQLLVNVSANAKTWRAQILQADFGLVNLLYLGDTIFRDGAVVLQPNAYENAPLSAELICILQIPTNIKIEVIGKGSQGVSIGKTYSDWTEQYRVPVYGFYQNHRNEVRITLLDREGRTRMSESIFLQRDTYSNASFNVSTNNLAADDQALYFASDLKTGFDQQGEVRWVWTGGGQYLFRKLRNGHLLMTTSEDQVSYHSKYFVEMTLSGRIVRQFEVPNYFHHEIRELSNGNFLIATNSSPIVLGNGKLQEDTIIEMDRFSGEIIREWDFSTILDPQRLRLPGERVEDWLHMNAIWLDEERNEMLISARAQSVIAAVSYPEGDLLWLLGDHNEWSDSFMDKLLQPVNANGENMDPNSLEYWPYGQHAVMTLDNGNILLYDNGRYRDYYQDSNAPSDSYSRAVEYRIDRDAKKVEKVWEYNPSNSLFTAFTGDVDVLPNGNRLVAFMWGSANTPRIVELDGDQVVFEAVIQQGTNMYRAEKIYLYE